MLAFVIWYVVLVISLCFPPLLLITGLPLALTVKGVYDAYRHRRALSRAMEAYYEQEACYRNARQVRGML